MSRLNYGLAIDHRGNYQVVDTSDRPGIRDDYSYYLSEPFIYYVAPHQHIEQVFKIDHLSGGQYVHMRSMLLKLQGEQLKDVILAWHGVKRGDDKKPTWS